jgi:hypothetical protein
MKRHLITLLSVAAIAASAFGQATPAPKNFVTLQPVNGDSELFTMQKLLAIANGGAPIVVGGATSANQSTQITAEQAIQAAVTSLLSSTRVSSSAYEASHVLKASAGNLISIAGYNSGPAQFIQLFNSTTVPANATAPAAVFAVPTASNFSFDVPITGIPFTTGIAVSNSTTGPTKTIGAADCYFISVVK